jgi:hypothetical protein
MHHYWGLQVGLPAHVQQVEGVSLRNASSGFLLYSQRPHAIRVSAKHDKNVLVQMGKKLKFLINIGHFFFLALRGTPE